MELLWLGQDGNAIVVSHEQSPLDMSFAKLKPNKSLMARARTVALLVPSASGTLQEKWRSSIETRVGQPLRQVPVRFAPQPVTRSGLNRRGEPCGSGEPRRGL